MPSLGIEEESEPLGYTLIIILMTSVRNKIGAIVGSISLSNNYYTSHPRSDSITCRQTACQVRRTAVYGRHPYSTDTQRTLFGLLLHSQCSPEFASFSG